MDTSFWIQCNPKISVEHSTKKYYGQYLYKLVLYAPAGRVLDSKDPVEQSIELRKRAISRHINFGGYWGSFWKNLENVDVEYLKLLKEIKHNRSSEFKFRIEEPNIQIYAHSLESLESLILNKFDAKYYSTFLEVCGPKDNESAKLLDSGAILRKKDCGYQYKIIIKDGNYGQDIKHNLLNYLEKLDPTVVHLTKAGRTMLTSNSNYIWNLYLFANDPGIVSFLNIMYPGMVSNYHELVVVPDK